ncbi:hypothetical protein CEUSTIGMA_g12068.t1 [Chlamydomonas eustigma]|uniref:Protein kinase domain-containing protein n=1 Tax=Chlamydomonas eustigma TaxID=1157962 RepID=A0A250XNJ9_9CHLO|nr:hypothetical protein CEUSTIGMA_g12068.t1 [Chlamydomonas eustigma]|eukprot:GAX84647.1 hypothetical protein CEUSTIGMA_g12068.t1 [Chlamydomonas eustigma]
MDHLILVTALISSASSSAAASPQVSDFGTSLFMDATCHVEGLTLGTSGYAAPSETLTTGHVEGPTLGTSGYAAPSETLTTGHVEGPTLGTSGYAAPSETLTTGHVEGPTLGTSGYAAPTAADVYSLGCMLYAMISGQQAHQGLYSNDQEYSELMLSGSVPQLTLRPEDVAMYGKIAAPLLQDLVIRTTHMEPQQRPSMKEVLDLLLNIKMNIMS